MIVKIKQNCTTAQNELLAAVVIGNFRDSHREKKMTKRRENGRPTAVNLL